MNDAGPNEFMGRTLLALQILSSFQLNVYIMEAFRDDAF